MQWMVPVNMTIGVLLAMFIIDFLGFVEINFSFHLQQLDSLTRIFILLIIYFGILTLVIRNNIKILGNRVEVLSYSGRSSEKEYEINGEMERKRKIL